MSNLQNGHDRECHSYADYDFIPVGELYCVIAGDNRCHGAGQQSGADHAALRGQFVGLFRGWPVTKQNACAGIGPALHRDQAWDATGINWSTGENITVQ